MKILCILVGVVLVVLVAWRLFERPRPAHPPLTIGDDDPDMKNAMAKAQDTVSEFRRLYPQHPDGALVKVPFITSSGRTEYLAAEVLEIVEEDVRVRLSTPPVTHQGKVERLQTFPIKKIVDWVIVMPGEKREGGFTMRVMFKKAREQWGELPPDISVEEKKYE
jgi:uncharacterized protein YegJ (DUF2314 family)